MLRLETSDDYHSISKLVAESYKEANLEYDLDMIRVNKNFDSKFALVVQEGWSAVGYLACYKTDSILEIKSFAVLNVLQNSGVGLQLVMELVDLARAQNITKIVVKSDLKCFERYGFKRFEQNNSEYSLTL